MQRKHLIFDLALIEKFRCPLSFHHHANIGITVIDFTSNDSSQVHMAACQSP